MKIKKRYATAALILLMLSVSYLFFATHHKKIHKKIETTYIVTTPWVESLNIQKEYVAQIRSIQHIEIRSLERGYLENIYVDEGQFIKKGTKMFQIMPLFLRAKWEKAMAEYEISKIEYKNTKMLASKSIVSNNELSLSKARLDKSKAIKELANIHLQFTTITAPFDGIMDRFQVRLGSLVEEGQLLTTLSDNSNVWVYFNVSEVDYLELKQQENKISDTPVSLKLANGKIYNEIGKIDTVEADFNNQTGNIAFRASFPNSKGLLRHGQTGTIILTEHLKNVLVVPQKSTFEILDKRYLYILDKESKVKAHEIEIEAEVPHLFVIRRGIKNGQKFLLDGISQIHNGQYIKTTFEDSTKVKEGLHLPIK